MSKILLTDYAQIDPYYSCLRRKTQQTGHDFDTTWRKVINFIQMTVNLQGEPL